MDFAIFKMKSFKTNVIIPLIPGKSKGFMKLAYMIYANQSLLSLSTTACTASCTMPSKPCFLSTCTPSMVVPPGEQT